LTGDRLDCNGIRSVGHSRQDMAVAGPARLLAAKPLSSQLSKPEEEVWLAREPEFVARRHARPVAVNPTV
jgi:hypothetical protein